MNDENDIIRYYRKEAGWEEQVSEPFQQEILQEWLVRLSKTRDIKDWTVLDFGSGLGCNLKTLKDFVNEIVAADINQKAVDTAKKKYGNRNISYVLLDGKRLPFKDGIFNLVVATEVFEHLPNPKKIVFELSRVLSSQGYFITSAPNYFNLTGMIKKIKDMSNSRPTWGPWGGHEGGLERFTTWQSIERLICGFKILDTRGGDYYKAWFYGNPFMPARIRNYILLWPGRLPLFKKLGMNYYILAQKN